MGTPAIRCLYDELVPVADLKPHPKNRNQHPGDQIDRLAKLIAYQGVRAPVVVSKLSGYIVKGHGTLLAFDKVGGKKAPVVYQEFVDEAQEYAFLQGDNAIAAWAELDLSGINADLGDLGPDFDIDMLGLKDFELVIGDTLEPQCDEDETPEAPAEPKTRLGDVYQLGRHRLMCGNSMAITDIDRLMDGASPDMVYTDPPYGIDIYSKGSFHDGKKHGNALAAHNNYRPVAGDEDLTAVKETVGWCLMQPKVVLWGANNFPQYVPPSNGWLVWDKEQHANHGDCELAYTNVDKAIRMFTHKWVGFQKASERGEKRVHPTQKPVALAEWAFETLDAGKNIADIFGGSGSTLIACEKTNRRCFMMELDPHYCDVIVARWEKYTGKTAKLLTEREAQVG